jgi:hypothetical protein
MKLSSARRVAGAAAHHPIRGPCSACTTRPSHRPFALPHSVNVSALIAKELKVHDGAVREGVPPSEAAAQDPLREERARLERHFSASWRGSDARCERFPASKRSPSVSRKATQSNYPARLVSAKTFIARPVTDPIRRRASRRCSPRGSSVFGPRKGRHRTAMKSVSDTVRRRDLVESFLDALEGEIVSTLPKCASRWLPIYQGLGDGWTSAPGC